MTASEYSEGKLNLKIHLQIAITSCIKLVQKSTETDEKRYTVRALMALNTSSLRAKFSRELLAEAVNKNASASKKQQLLPILQGQASSDKVDGSVEVDTYLTLVVVVFLLDQKSAEGKKLATAAINEAQSANKRTLDPITAKLYFYYATMFCQDSASIRSELMDAYRLAVLRHDDYCQAALINLILRNYLHQDQYSLAETFVAKTHFPENAASNNESARYLYLVGRIKAVMLKYSEARSSLLQAIRKAPSGVYLDKKTKKTSYEEDKPLVHKGAVGFLQAAHVMFITVQLLMGEIPDRSEFRIPILSTTLEPYYHLVVAVRNGDLALFQQVVAKYSAKFEQHKTVALVQRLRHNVIKTGIRLISLSYSKISLRDICFKLNLDSEEDAEYIVAKAIADGVIDAHIDHKGAFLATSESENVYSSTEPQSAYDTRIKYCLQLKNESVKALRYPSEEKQITTEKSDEQAALEAELATLEEGDFGSEEDEF